MSDLTSHNEKLPSSADSLDGAHKGESLRDRLNTGAETVREKVEEVSERAGTLYESGNVAVARRLDAVPAIALAAIVGFAAGYVAGAGRR